MHVPTRLPEERRVRARQPRLRAVVPRAHGRRGRRAGRSSSSPSSSAAPSTASTSSSRFGESDYYRARPTIAIPRPNGGDDAALDLDGFFGFNPRLQPLKPLWDSRQLAIVHACGSPDSTRSHFDAQDYMESGDARREEHARRLAEPLPAGAARRARDAVPRRRADAAAAAHAAGHGAGAGRQPARAVRHPRRPVERHGRRVVRGRVRRGRRLAC